MQNEKYDAIVVGGGISGLMSALVLSKHGNRVLVLEKDEVVGGNCRSYQVDGFTVDTGPHAITALRGGPLPLLMDQYYDVVPQFQPYGNYYIRTPDASLVGCPTNVRDFLMFDYLPVKDRMKLAKTIGAVMLKVSRGEDYSDRSVYDCLPEGLGPETLGFANTFSMFMSGRGMKETSVQRMAAGAGVAKEKNKLTPEEYKAIVKGKAGKKEEKKEDKKDEKKEKDETKEKDGKKGKDEKKGKGKKKSKTSQPADNNDSVLAAFKKTLTHKGGFSTQGYPIGGVQAVTDCTLRSMPALTEIQTETRVQKILAEFDSESGKDKAIGVETADAEYYADLIIHTGFASALPQMMELPAEYVNQLKGIDHTVSLSVWLGLDEMRPEFDYVGSEVWFKEMPYWGGPISNYDPNLAPEGCQSVGFAFIPQQKDVKAKVDDAYNQLFELLPDIEKHVAMRHDQITVPEKAAITVRGEFADIRSPIENLYIAGTDTDKRSMGVTRAAYSVMELIGKLHADGMLKRQNDFKGYNFKRDYLPPIPK
ncbi:phytoene desaturase family protein [Methanimicrococcus blatticola]|uniref:UDP-galactopyranose mutase n=1 Tax=Methanimicrococcus blatticola TaxID=91560 RepID=A0A484F4V5_9EURY|nr:NAD(P)/FAD-dependent oxidoreductase [Methanimicrococcus blatticola]MBZ3935816.1 NAD(P)/FAD-dependent oxidoreductase [Methanimicrococcus blatticola]MCC2508064.1 NAD(P)/FAD-dependent oxidoreductase [Methanimicrococcus blatticola]TDQ68856.1 UDP-galactopyranose mutase [Methanimicrococcus blatticola]